MRLTPLLNLLLVGAALTVAAAPVVSRSPSASPRPADPGQALERTCFQTFDAYDGFINIRADVAIAYGIDAGLPGRLKSWRDQGYRVHLMTGVAWGNYQDYLYGRFDGVNHEDQAQTDRDGNKISHGGDVYYMSPSASYGRYLCVGVQRALEAGAEAVHLEEPEFWVRGGYGEGFKREWRAFYGEDWTPPHLSVDAQWRASKLMYHLYRQALQQVFDFVQAWNRDHGTRVRCYVPTHSLISYSQIRIVSPESSLARLNGCDGYIAQVWTGTARYPNRYRGFFGERTFEAAFLEYGAMQNLVRSTGRRVWYLHDPVEDDPNHNWEDYRRNWEATVTASLLQPDVWRFEVMPWPSRIFGGRYPSRTDPAQREPIPPDYATEIQTVLHALNDMNQPDVAWDCGTQGVGVIISDSLMFQRGDPHPSDAELGHFFGLAMPLVKRGIPVEPVQLENVPLPGYLRSQRLLLMSYQGLKPLGPEVHPPLARWVKEGGVLVFCDDDADPYNQVREWWNRGDAAYATPRQHLFALLGLGTNTAPGRHAVGGGVVYLMPKNPAQLAAAADGDRILMNALQEAIQGTRVPWRETDHLLLRRGPYIVAAGLEESVPATPKTLPGRFVNLFDPELRLRRGVTLEPGSRCLLLDLDRATRKGPAVLASACKVWPEEKMPKHEWRAQVEGAARTEAVMLLRWTGARASATLDGQPVTPVVLDTENQLLWLRFPNTGTPRRLVIAER